MPTTTIAGSAAGTTRTTIFTGTCGTFAISNRSTSAGPVYVLVTGIHDAASPLVISPGVSWPLRNGDRGIGEVKIYGDGTNAATVDSGVLVR